MSSCTYLILPIAELNNIDYNECGLNGVYDSTVVPKNLAGTEFVVKWHDAMPTSIYDIEPVGDENVKDCKTHDEIITILASADWTDPNAQP